MRRTVFLAAASWVCGLGVSAQQHNIDTQKSTLTIHVGKTGIFSGLGHEHEVRAPIHSGTGDTGSHPAVEVHVDARALRVIGKDEPEKDRAEVQKTMLGPEVLDSERHQEIVFKSTGAEPAGPGRWTLRGNLTLRGRPP
jgi:polyisoprenoid-binding protein YceI